MPVIAFAEPHTARLTATSRLASARQAFNREKTTRLRLDANKLFSAAHLLKLAGLLPLEEVSVILAGEEKREQALSFARSGHLDRAEERLEQAAAISADAELSDHALVAIRASQLAADAYLAYRRGRYDAAIRDLEVAIEACVLLETRFDHDMEFRRVHLARNILRVRSFCAPAAEVVAESIDLLRYIGGDPLRWPFAAGRGVGEPVRMTAGQRAWAIDEVLVNFALTELDICAGRDSMPDLRKRQYLHGHVLASFEWCLAMIAWRADDARAFTRHAASFFEYRLQDLVHAGRILDNIIDDGSFLGA
jgi:hypothetical protein